MAPVDWGAEWLRPVTPNFKMVGPILSQPGRPLPADLEVTSWSHTQHGLATSLLLSAQRDSEKHAQYKKLMLAGHPAKAWQGMSGMVADHVVPNVQEFMESAGERGVLLIALGTVTETSEPSHQFDLRIGRHVIGD